MLPEFRKSFRMLFVSFCWIPLFLLLAMLLVLADHRAGGCGRLANWQRLLLNAPKCLIDTKSFFKSNDEVRFFFSPYVEMYADNNRCSTPRGRWVTINTKDIKRKNNNIIIGGKKHRIYYSQENKSTVWYLYEYLHLEQQDYIVISLFNKEVIDTYASASELETFCCLSFITKG